MITIKVFEDYNEMSAYAAEIVKEVINSIKTGYRFGYRLITDWFV